MQKSMFRAAFDCAYPSMLRFGLDPLKKRDVRNFPRFWRERRRFIEQGGRVDESWPILGDYRENSGSLDAHYFNQDLLVATMIHEAAPANHCDVGSRIDGFVAHVATFRPIDVIDIRPPPNVDHPNIRFHQADLMNPRQSLAGSFDSVSCLHALEHFGLGRYIDPIDPAGHRKGFEAILALVAPGGTGLCRSSGRSATNRVQRSSGSRSTGPCRMER
ncbi:hypothetical protein ABDK56_02865 [Sphingomonas sp. ASV193]|uniref:hypothetical protein n=1 Tax=Sphingomonas sp. ASV193 TaxID=3144405 RepID=UPI0032E898BC